MFERIKAYRNLKKADKFLEGVQYTGEIMNDKDMVNDAINTLNKNKALRKEIIFNGKKAKKYNQECKNSGLF